MFKKKGKTVVTVKIRISKETLETAKRLVEKVREVYPYADVYVEIK